MDRRDFIKQTALPVGALGVSGQFAEALYPADNPCNLDHPIEVLNPIICLE
jgi:hypothetical protein